MGLSIKRGIELTQGSGGTYAAGNIDDKLNALILGQAGGWKEAWLGKVSQAFQEVAKKHKGKAIQVIAIKGGPACDWEREQLNGVVKTALGEQFNVVELDTYDEYEDWLQKDFKKISSPRVMRTLSLHSRGIANPAYSALHLLNDADVEGGHESNRERGPSISTDSYAAAQ